MAERKESICRNCFHSYVCEQFNENKDDNNEKCHFANDHYIPRANVVPKSEVKKLQQENETLKDNNEHLAVILAETKEEANRYKRYFFHHDYDEMIAEVLDKLDGFINSNCIEIKDERGIKGYVTSGVHFAIAELKKKHTE